MFEIVRNGDVIEVRVMGDFPRAEGLRACAEVRDLAYVSGVVLDLREMTNLPAPGRGEALAEEMPGLLPGLRVAGLARADTAFYGVVRQIVTLTKGDFQLFEDRDAALAWVSHEH